LRTERDPLPVPIHLENLDLNFLADLDDLARMIDVVPRELAYVDQSVYPLKVHERPEVDEVRDRARDDVALLERSEDAMTLLLTLLLEYRPTAQDHVVPASVELYYFALQALAHKRVEVPDTPDVHQARWQESPETDVYDETALDYLDDRPFDRALVLVGLLDALPSLLEGRPLSREDQAPVRVLLLQNQGLYVLPELHDLLRVHTLADGELVGGD
jgi:hypothetical protein